MARSDVYGQMSSDRRDVSVGGRHNPSYIRAWLNSDNATHNDCSVSVSVESVGERHYNGKTRKTCDCRHRWENGSYAEPNECCPKCGQPRQGQDTRKSVFTIELPEQTDEYCEVELKPKGFRLAALAFFGGMLVAVKGATEVMQGDVEKGKMTISKAKDLLAEIGKADAERKYPRVTLPDGTTLAHALACVEIVKGLIENESSQN